MPSPKQASLLCSERTSHGTSIETLKRLYTDRRLANCMSEGICHMCLGWTPSSGVTKSKSRTRVARSKSFNRQEKLNVVLHALTQSMLASASSNNTASDIKPALELIAAQYCSRKLPQILPEMYVMVLGQAHLCFTACEHAVLAVNSEFVPVLSTC